MFFRNLTFFRFPISYGKHLLELAAGQADADEQLQGLLASCALRPVGPIEFMTRGWIPPLGREHDALFHQVGSAVWLCLGGEERILPDAVVQRAVTEKIQAIEETEGRKVGGRARKRIKEDVVAELLPKAFVRPTRLNAYLDLELGLLVVDSSSRKAAEEFASELRHTLGSFPAFPLNAETAPRAILTAWLAGEQMPESLALGSDCELKDPVDGGATWKGACAELYSDEVKAHLEAGMQCTRLAMILDEHVSFAFSEDLTVRKLKFLDAALEPMEGTEIDGVAAELDARFTLMAGEVRRLFLELAENFKFSGAAEGEPGLPAAGARPARPERPAAARPTALRGPGGREIEVPEAVLATACCSLEELQATTDVVLKTASGSISGVQRRLKLGYNAAARRIEALEALGVVSAPNKRGDRHVVR